MAVFLTELPAGGRWDFGGREYGLEPLVLPPPGDPTEPADENSWTERVRVCRQLEAVLDNPRSVSLGAPPDDLVYWFRWITGHQVSFVLWRLIAQTLADLESGRVSPEAASTTLAGHINGCSVMLLYTGSCPPDIYHAVIRASMRLHHPAFSGTWAPDYGPVRALFRRSVTVGEPDGPVARAVRTNQLMHAGVAAALVPDGPSLLQACGLDGSSDLRQLQAIYDCYFLTLRARTTQGSMVAQLLRRLTAIVQDLDVSGLRPGLLDEPGFGTPGIRQLADDSGRILAEVATAVAEPRPRRRR